MKNEVGTEMVESSEEEPGVEGVERTFDPEHFRLLTEEGVEAWNAWRNANPEVSPNLVGADLGWAEIEGANLQKTNLREADLPFANLREADLFDADLHGANLEGANLEGADLIGADLGKAFLPGASLRGAHLGEAELREAFASDADFTEALLEEASLQGAELGSANLDGASLRYANLQGVRLENASLQGADLRFAVLSDTTWSGAKITRDTLMDPVYFSPSHYPLNDGSETIQLPAWDRWLTWGRIRWIGTLPLFEVSNSAFVLSVLTITGIGFLNSSQFLAMIEYPIPLPQRMVLLLYTSLCLMAGSWIYKLWCPHRVQEFSETTWVEELGRPRLLYLAKSLARWGPGAALVPTVIGGVLGLWLLLDRLWVTFQYLREYL